MLFFTCSVLAIVPLVLWLNNTNLLGLPAAFVQSPETVEIFGLTMIEIYVELSSTSPTKKLTG
jgi:hypothetical protein